MRLFINSFPPPTSTSKNKLNYVKYYNEILPRNFFSIVFFSLVKSTESALKIFYGRPTVSLPPSLPFYCEVMLTVESCLRLTPTTTLATILTPLSTLGATSSLAPPCCRTAGDMTTSPRGSTPSPWTLCWTFIRPRSWRISTLWDVTAG